MDIAEDSSKAFLNQWESMGFREMKYFKEETLIQGR